MAGTDLRAVRRMNRECPADHKPEGIPTVTSFSTHAQDRPEVGPCQFLAVHSTRFPNIQCAAVNLPSFASGGRQTRGGVRYWVFGFRPNLLSPFPVIL